MYSNPLGLILGSINTLNKYGKTRRFARVLATRPLIKASYKIRVHPDPPFIEVSTVVKLDQLGD